MRKKYREFLKSWVPPGGIRVAQRLLGSVGQARLEYTPKGWETVLEQRSDSAGGWNAPTVGSTESERWAAYVRNCSGAGPLGFAHEYQDTSTVDNVSFHNVHITYAYVLALVSRQKSAVSVLDWGGGLGHYFILGKAVCPEVTLDFHCKEVQSIAQIGSQLNPEVHWYTDDSCLERQYDLVMINGSLQYFQDWELTLQRIAPSVRDYLFLTRLPVVDRGPGFVAIQRDYGTEMLHQQLNAEAVVKVVQQTGLTLVREFVVGDRPFIKNAPEQCELRGWLFKRVKNTETGEND